MALHEVIKHGSLFLPLFPVSVHKAPPGRTNEFTAPVGHSADVLTSCGLIMKA